MAHDLPKAYDPGAIEPRWAEYWVREELFRVETPRAGAAEPVFSLLLPPPNVTGRLHMGHMLNQTEMDIIIRWRRMSGFRTLWLPGTDHAGIATQMMVERQLATEGADRRALGRDAFIQRVWQWRQEYGGAILAQMKRLGASVDWEREYFTMDQRLSRAVREAFVRLHEEGLIYRGKYIVNWCPRCMTAISDLEVAHEEFPGKLYEIRYPVVETDEHITVATTRPETMLGDTAVAVNPADERYAHLHAKHVLLPLASPDRRDSAGRATPRQIPIILDQLADPQYGTGAVKVTPAHDPNDFQAGLRHGLPQVDVMDDTARMNQNAGPYAGLDRFEARERVLQDLRAQELLAGVRDHVHAIGKCDRCKTIVEPRLSTQWFVAVNKAPRSGGVAMARRAIEVVEDGSIRFTPENYKTIYLNWMNNIHDWCISRQLWWGHRIPAWHCSACGEVSVSRDDLTSCPKCKAGSLEQDPDVLDTWFSSGLLPFTVFGWPQKTRDLAAFYPTSLLITGFDILFFWVARMIMLGCHFMHGHNQDPAIKQASGDAARKDDSVPYREVYIHALVRDAERQKMSKTKGNVLDPIAVTEQYGTDAVRFTLASMASPGTDIAFSESRTEGYRAFANKIWNAARFLFMNVDKAQQDGVWSLAEFSKLRVPHPEPAAAGEGWEAKFSPATLEDRWILSRFNLVAGEVHAALEACRFDEAARLVYDFFWGEFCDWYIELAKPRLLDADRAAFQNLVAVFEAALRLLSPFMPFLTEELWHALYEGKPPHKSIALAPYPVAEAAQVDEAAEREMAVLQELIVSIRNLRAELKVETKARVPVEVHAADGVRASIERNRGALQRLAGVEDVRFVESLQGSAGRSTPAFDVAVTYEKSVDPAAERARLEKELTKYEAEMANAQRQLGNQQFLAKAPAKVVEGIRRRQGELEVLLQKTRAALKELP